MGKYYGKIGYETTEKIRPGVHMPTIVERDYYGNITRSMVKHEPSSGVNDNLNISNTLSIIADPYAYNHMSEIRYVWMYNARWKVTSVEDRYPRLILTIGGVYNDCDGKTT